jgi:hypothetical protein
MADKPLDSNALKASFERAMRDFKRSQAPKPVFAHKTEASGFEVLADSEENDKVEAFLTSLLDKYKRNKRGI